MLRASTPSPRTSRRRAVVSVAAVAALALVGVAGASAGATAAQAATPRVPFASALPSWAKKANTVGSPSPTSVVEGEVFLDLQPGAATLAAAVSDPASPQYRKYLTPAQWIATYSPTQAALSAQVASITGTSAKPTGLTVTGTPASRQYIVFRGTVKAVNAHFGTTLATYSVAGHDVVAPSTTPSLPTAQAAHVAGLVLDQSRLLTRPDSASQSEATGAAAKSKPIAFSSLVAPKAAVVSTPCSAYANQRTVRIPAAYGRTTAGTANCGYTPKQLRSVYRLSSTAGAGQTVAIIDAYNAPTIVADANTYSRVMGEPQFAAGQYRDYSVPKSAFTDQAACGWASGWQGEQTLDVEALHGIAPKANIVYVGASNCGGGTDLALSKVLDQGLASIVSNSYGGVGEPTGAGASDYIDGEVNLQLQAAGEGIGLYFASGDNGDERAAVGHATADFPASSPWVTSVGGTSLGISSSGARAYETGWGDTLDQITTTATARTPHYHQVLPGTLFGGGAGGGRSYVFTRPSYQTTALVASNVGSGSRVGPDLAAVADPYTGFRVAYHPITNNSTLATGGWSATVAGGTSLATPLVAGMMAAVQQQTGVRVGFANPTVYSLKKTKPATVLDVGSTSKPSILAYSTSQASYLITQNVDTSYRASSGFDFVTGLGVLNMTSTTGFRAGR
jgi:subtilase family serine protease